MIKIEHLILACSIAVDLSILQNFLHYCVYEEVLKQLPIMALLAGPPFQQVGNDRRGED